MSKRLLVLFACLLAACQQVTQSTPTAAPITEVAEPVVQPPPTTTAVPTVTATATPKVIRRVITATPTVGATAAPLEVSWTEGNVNAWLPETPITFTFSEPIRKWNPNGPLHITPYIAGAWEWNETQTAVTFTPRSGFETGRTYSIRRNTPFASESGQTMPENFEVILNVLGYPIVRSRHPTASRTGDWMQPMQLTFSRAMDRASVEQALFITPELPVTFDWEADNVVTIRPNSPLLLGQDYEFTLDRTALGTYGYPLKHTTWSLRTEVLGQISAETLDTPYPDELDQPRTVQFNYPISLEHAQANVVISPTLPVLVTIDTEQNGLIVQPHTRWQPDTHYTASFGALEAVDGTRLPDAVSLQFKTKRAIRFNKPTGSNVTADTPITIQFDRAMDRASVEAALTISPPAEGGWEWTERSITFVPDGYLLESDTRYTVRLEKTALGLDGEPIRDKPLVWSFTTMEPRQEMWFGIGTNVQQVDPTRERLIQFAHTGIDWRSMQFELYRISAENLQTHYLRNIVDDYGYYQERSTIDTSHAELAKTWSFEEPSIVNETYDVDISELAIPADVPEGFYILNLRAGHIQDQMFVMLSSNALVTKRAGDQITVWGSSLDGQPTSGASVKLIDGDKKTITQGTTNEIGVFKTTSEQTPSYILVEDEDGGIALARFGWHWRHYDSWRDQIGRSFDNEPMLAAIWTERPIYRPGQTVFYKAIVRRNDDATISLPTIGTQVIVRIRDARDNVVQTRYLRTNAFGTVNGRFELADGAMLGDYEIEVAALGATAQQTFKVQDYRKPDYKVDVTIAEDTIVLGEPIHVTVQSDYFLGAPVANASVTLNAVWRNRNSVYRNGRYYRTTNWTEIYGNQTKHGRTDANGQFTDDLYISESRMYGNNIHWRSSVVKMTVGIQADVGDGSGQPVGGLATVDVYNSAEILRFDTNGYRQDPNTPFTITGDVVDIHGNPVPNRDVTFSLMRWNRSDSEYGVINTWSGRTNADGELSVRAAIPSRGYYRLEGKLEDSHGNAVTYRSWVYGYGGNSRWWSNTSNSLQIDVDQDRYLPGDVANLIVQSDFDGVALLTVERGTVRREQLVQLTSPVTQLELPVVYEDAPNVIVSLRAWKPIDNSLDAVGDIRYSKADGELVSARAELLVDVVDKRLDITIDTHGATFAPRDTVTVTMQVQDEQGQGVSAEFSLAVVDEAIFTLSEDLSKPLFDAFYFERNHLVQSFSSYEPERYLPYGGGKGGGGGGGDGWGSVNPRSDFPDTTLWLPTVETDENGMATVQLTLPDNLTQWRLTARATTVDTKVGETMALITTTQPFRVRPILPRTLTAGDELYLSALVQNVSGATSDLTVHVQADDALSVLDNAQTIRLAAGETQVVGWFAKAEAAGSAEITLTLVQSDTVVDAIRMPLDIRPLAVPDVQSEVGHFTQTLTTTFHLPDNALPMSTLNIQLSRSIAGTLLEGLDYLTGYPYGCVEQTMSRALPNAVVGRAFNQLGVAATDPELPKKINQGIQKLYGLQHHDGGWGWWYSDGSDAYQTAWVLFGLTQTQQAGYEVDPNVLANATDYLLHVYAKQNPRTRAYILYSVALAGGDGLERAQKLVDNVESLDAFSQAALTLALHEWGDDANVELLYQSLLAKAQTDNSGRVFWGTGDRDGAYQRKTMASSTRSTALALSVMSRLDPDNPLIPGTVRWLMDARRSRGWGTTNETSYAILGLTDHLLAVAHRERQQVSGYEVLIDGVVVESGRLGVGNPTTLVEISAETLATGDHDLVIRSTNKHPLYYTINNRLLLAQAEIEHAGNVTVQRRYERAGSNDDTTQFAAGDLVEVTLRIRMPSDASYLLIEDQLPGGLEALNNSLDNATYTPSNSNSIPRHSVYSYMEIHGERVSFFATELESGWVNIQYYARATRSGQFVAMPAVVEAMYDPTVWGRSDSVQITIGEVEQTPPLTQGVY